MNDDSDPASSPAEAAERAEGAAVGGGNNKANSRSGIFTIVSWAVTGFLLALVAAVLIYGVTREAPPPAAPKKKLANVQVSTVRTRPYREALVLPAVMAADRTASLSPEFGGKLARWLKEEGDSVEEGEVVAELDTEALRANLDELLARRKSAELEVSRARVALEGAKVSLENAKEDADVKDLALKAAHSELELARADHNRVKMLVEKQVMDLARLDTAKNTLTQARIGVERAKEEIAVAALRIRSAEVRVEEARTALAQARAGIGELDASVVSLRVQIEKARLKAPISGRIEEHLVEPGEFVAAGSRVADLYDLERLRASVHVPDRYVAFLDPSNPTVAEYIRQNRPGAVQEVNAKLIVPGLPKLTGGEHPGVELPAQIVRIAQASDPKSNTFEVELSVPNPASALKQGVIARARIEYLTYPRAIVIPVKAVQVTDAGPRVMVAERVEGGNVARVRNIEPASVSEDELLVLSGLKEGDRLIVAGWKGLVEGEEVNVIVEDGAFMAVGGGDGEE